MNLVKKWIFYLIQVLTYLCDFFIFFVDLLRRAGLRVLKSLFAHAFLRALKAFILVFAAVAVEIFFFADGGSRGRVRAFFAALGCIGATGSHGESEGCEGDGFDHSRSPVGGTGSKVAHLEGGRGKFALIVRKWWAENQKFLTDIGVAGVWNDMNEPAIFYSEKRLKRVFDKMEEYKTKNLDVNTFFEMTDLIGTISNNPEDYASFYHNYKGKRYRHGQDARGTGSNESPR